MLKAELTCPFCEKKSKHDASKLKSGVVINCPHCKKNFELEFENDEGLTGFDKSFRDLKKTIKKGR